MKKLMLKKEVVARIEHDEMNQLKGGYGDGAGTCWCFTGTLSAGRPPSNPNDCPSQAPNDTCNGTCAGPTCDGPTCGGKETCIPYQCYSKNCPPQTNAFDCPTGNSTPMKTC